MPVIRALARWDYDWTWSCTRRGEAVNIGTIFRTAPGLLSVGRSAKGTVELVVRGDRGGDRSYAVTLAGGNATISQQTVESTDAQVSGAIDAWVRALGPDGDTGGLQYSGDRALADAVVGGFTAAAAARADRATA